MNPVSAFDRPGQIPAGLPTPVGLHRVFALTVVLVLGSLPALLGADVVRQAASLYPLADSATPYFLPEHAALLYVWSPLVVLSAALFLLTPGLLLGLCLNAAATVGEWLVAGLALSLVVVSAAAAAVQVTIGAPLVGAPFAAVVGGSILTAAGLLAFRAARGRVRCWPLGEASAHAQILSWVVAPWLMLIALTPKVYWENFNDDGAHAFESSRLLLTRALPFWPESAGEIASFPGTNTALFCFPNGWFLRLFGDVEASVRLPLFLYLPALHGALMALIGLARPRAPGHAEIWLVWLALSIYVTAMAFSATYNPYCADVALPATQSTLLLVVFLGYTVAFLRRQTGWTWGFALLTLTASPNGLLLLGFWALAVLLAWRPRPWRDVGWAAMGVTGCVLFLAAATVILRVTHQPVPGGEHGPINLLKKFSLLRVNDWQRWAFVLVPTGVLPALALIAWRWQDPIARAFTAVTALYFACFYIQAHVALHYFVPVMVLPLVVFWRGPWAVGGWLRPLVCVGAGVAGVAALAISVPWDGALYTSGRTVGAALEVRLGGYETSDPTQFRHTQLLTRLFPAPGQPTVPHREYGGSPLIWNYYAHRDTPRGVAVYVLQFDTDPTPVGARLLGREPGAAVFVLDEGKWAAQRGLRPPTPAGSPMYVLPRSTLFRYLEPDEDPGVIDLAAAVSCVGLSKQRLTAWFGSR